MGKFEHNISLSEGRNPLISLIVILLLAFSGFQAIGPIIGVLLTLPFFDFNFMQALEVLSNPVGQEEAKIPIFIIQGLASIIGFIVIPLIYLRFIEKKPLHIFFNSISLGSVPVFLLTFIVLAFMFVNSVFIEWNANFKFPESMAGLENILKSLEEAAKTQTEFLTTFNGFGQFFLAFVVIAVIPAIGEELLFRGFVQNLLKRISGNIHVAIWVAGFLFSAFHMQFYGLVPRMLLGVLFGYLYYWSGSLSTAMVAHFINNGFTIIMMYLYQQNLTSLDVDTEESLPPTFLLILFVLFLGLVYFYRSFFLKHKTIG